MTNKKVIPAIINPLPLPTPPDNLAHIHIFCNFAQVIYTLCYDRA